MISPDYSMLSKTNVHHFAGNNVSTPSFFERLCAFRPNDQSDRATGLALRRSLDEASEGTDYMLTHPYRLN